MDYPKVNTERKYENYFELTDEDTTEDDNSYSEENNYGNDNESNHPLGEKKKKSAHEKGPPIVCLMCKIVWTKSRKGGRLFMFGGTRPFMSKFEAKLKALMGQEDLAALQQKSATKFGRSYICRECYLMVRQTYDNIRKLQRDVSKSILRVQSLEGSVSSQKNQVHSGSDEDLEINPQGHDIPKKKLPPVAERIAEKIANLLLVKINHKVPVVVLKPINVVTKDEHFLTSEDTESEYSHSMTNTNSYNVVSRGLADKRKRQVNPPLHSTSQSKIIINLDNIEDRINGGSVNQLKSKSSKQKSHSLIQASNSIIKEENVTKSRAENVYSSMEAAECSVISLNMDTSFASQHLFNGNASIETPIDSGSCREKQVDTVPENNSTNSLDSLSNYKPSFAEILANPLLLIKSSQPIKLAEVKNNNIYICGESGCDWIFSSRFFWENHIRHYHRSGKPFICPFEGCERRFTGKSKLELHVRSHTDERPFICDKCGSGFRGNQELRAHRLTHTSEKPHQCPKCDKNFKLLSSLKRHLQFHDGGEFPFPCTYPECEKAFKSKYDLKCHYRLHTGEKPYKCTEPGCGMAFRIPCQFTMHKRSHTGERPFRCTQEGCSVAYISSNALQAHMLSHTSERPFCCEFCGKTFKHKMLYRMHLKKHSGSQGFLCPVESCGEDYADRKTMDQHMVTNHGIHNHKQQNKKLFVCTETGCGLKYSTDLGLQCHILKAHKKENVQYKEETESRKLICPYDNCQREYDDSNNLHDHLAKSHMPTPREKMCPLCGQSFPYMEQLEQHMQNLHNGGSMLNEQMKGVFVCNSERCGVRFCHLEELKHHVNWHLGNPPYRCEFEECRRTFLLEATYTRHTMEHESHKPFTCSFDHCHEGYTSHMMVLKHSKMHYGFFRCPIDGCSKSMQTLSTARIHLQHHEKPYVCKLCGKRFPTSSQWVKHKRSHTGEKVYECKVCLCQFVDSDSLKCHKQIHKGEKKYMCEECGQRFSSHVSCKNHMKSHSKLPFACPEDGCGKAFGENTSLKAHMNVHSKPSHLCTQCGKVYKFSVSKHKCKVEPEEQMPSALNIDYMQQQQQQQQPLQQHMKSALPLALPHLPSTPQPVVQQLPDGIPQVTSQALPHAVSQPMPQALSQPMSQLLTQSLPQSLPQFIPSTLSQSLPQTLSQSLPQHPPPQQYLHNVMMSELPPQSYVMEVEEAARAMRQNFGAPDTIVVDPPYYNYIILYDRPVQQ